MSAVIEGLEADRLAALAEARRLRDENGELRAEVKDLKARLRALRARWCDCGGCPWREADGAFALCDESGERLSSRCVASGGLAMGPQGFLTARMCFSADPKGCL